MTTTAQTDLPYGPHARNLLDFYHPGGDAPAPLYVYYHGGGFRGGDKSTLAPELRDLLLAAGVAVAAVNYRLSDTAPYPAAFEDSARALQHLRYHAADLGVDTRRVGIGGSSAGSGISFWIGFRQDLADPASDDPVARESTAVSCITVHQAQCSYDLRYIRELIAGDAWRHEALGTFFELTADDLDSDHARRVLDDVHFIAHATADAPPVMLWYRTADLPMTDDLPPGPGIHHPKFGMVLRERLLELGVPCELRMREDRPELDDEALLSWFHQGQAAFLQQHLSG
jgi:acetyl esterase/lipase